jgi:hypothetical protein
MTIYGREMNYANGQLVSIRYYPLLAEVAIYNIDESLPILTYPELPDFANGDVIQGEVSIDVCTGSYNGNYPTY